MDYLFKNSQNNMKAAEAVLAASFEYSYFRKFFLQDFRSNTKKAFTSDFAHFLRWYKEANREQFVFNRLTESDIIHYKEHCLQKEHAVSTINRRLTHLRVLCDFAVQEKRMTQNVAKKVKLLSIQRLAPKSLDFSDLRKLMKEVEIRGNLRDRLIVSMLAGAGFRVSELVNLRMQDICITDRKGHAVVRNAKGGKTREVPLNKEIRWLFEKYVEKYCPTDRVFLGQRGALKTIAFNRIIDFYAKKAGIKCSPHRLRHTFAYRFLEQNPGEIVSLSQILGHSSLNTTAIYTQNRLEDLQAKVEGMRY